MKTNSRSRRAARQAKARARWAGPGHTASQKKGHTLPGVGLTNDARDMMSMLPSREAGGLQARIPPRT